MRPPRASPRACRRSRRRSSDYSKKALPSSSATVEKLLGAKSVETAVQIQTDYAKSAYEGFVAQANKINEIYIKLATEAFKPVEAAFTKLQVQVSHANGRARSRGRVAVLTISGSASRRPFLLLAARLLIEIRTCAPVANWRILFASRRPLAPEARGA